jgi:hypothetical protein
MKEDKSYGDLLRRIAAELDDSTNEVGLLILESERVTALTLKLKRIADAMDMKDKLNHELLALNGITQELL